MSRHLSMKRAVWTRAAAIPWRSWGSSCPWAMPKNSVRTAAPAVDAASRDRESAAKTAASRVTPGPCFAPGPYPSRREGYSGRRSDVALAELADGRVALLRIATRPAGPRRSPIPKWQRPDSSRDPRVHRTPPHSRFEWTATDAFRGKICAVCRARPGRRSPRRQSSAIGPPLITSLRPPPMEGRGPASGAAHHPGAPTSKGGSGSRCQNSPAAGEDGWRARTGRMHRQARYGGSRARTDRSEDRRVPSRRWRARRIRSARSGSP